MFSYFNTFACISYVSFAGWTAAKSAAAQLQASTCSKAWLIFFAPRHVRQEDVAWIPWIGGFGYVWMLQENPNCIDNLTSGTRRFCQRLVTVFLHGNETFHLLIDVVRLCGSSQKTATIAATAMWQATEWMHPYITRDNRLTSRCRPSHSWLQRDMEL